jgi:hypothetical protein
MPTMRRSPLLLIPKERVETFFATYIHGWLLHDIRFCAGQQENLSFAVATLALNAIDFVGSLYAGKNASSHAFTEFLNKYMPEYSDFDPRFYDSYRCGLVHQYFPKACGGIVWNIPEEHLKQNDGRLTVNAQSLAKDVERAIADYKHDLESDKELQRRFSEQMNRIVPNVGTSPDTLMLGDAGVGRSDSEQVRHSLFGSDVVFIDPEDN